MIAVTLTEVKKQCRIDDTAEDDLLTLYANAAEQAVQRFLPDDLANYAAFENGVPSDIKVAVLLQTALLYKNREPVQTAAQYTVPYANLENLLIHYKNPVL